MNSDKNPEPTIDLYLSQFTEVEGFLRLKGGEQRPVILEGEILFSQPAGLNTLAIEEFRRVSVWIRDVDELGGLTSFAGPANPVEIKPGPDGSLQPFDMLLFYPHLGSLEPTCKDNDASFPPLDTLSGWLSWNLVNVNSDNSSVTVCITIHMDKLLAPVYLGEAEGLEFGPAPLVFQRLPEGPVAISTHKSLSACGGSPLTGSSKDQRKIIVRFINLSNQYSSLTSLVVGESLETILQRQIDSACEVWHQKELIQPGGQPLIVRRGGLLIEPEPDFPQPLTSTDDPFVPPKGLNPLDPFYDVSVQPKQPRQAYQDPQDPNLFRITQTQESDVYGYRAGINVLEVYLVDRLSDRPGGGVTHNCGTSDAFMLLEIGKIQHNRYLFAHELGHVLGLRHPGPAAPGQCTGSHLREGSYCSVMVPSSPNSPRNTEVNLGVLDVITPLGMLVSSLAVKFDRVSQAEQGFFNFLRDFPLDDGTPNSVPELPARDWWSVSDVWNSDQLPISPLNSTAQYADNTNMFNDDLTPHHKEPSRSSDPANQNINIQNYLYVRVHACQPVTGPVKVHLFIAIPGSASLSPIRITPTAWTGTPVGLLSSNNPVEFSGSRLPKPDQPVTWGINWKVPSTPYSLPSHSCIFAVVDSGQDRPINAQVQNLIDNVPGTYNFFTLANQVAPDNNVAQRNLHIQEVAPANPSPLQTVLNWIQADNPLDQTVPAFLEVDTRHATGLAKLILEVEGNPSVDIKLSPANPVQRFEISPALPPGERRIIRLRAEMPQKPPIGMTFPINLGIFMGDVQVSGFQHLLRVASLRDATIQVLDWLYAAMEDVGVGCHVPAARQLARGVRIIWLREHWNIKPPRGCLFWPFKLLGFRTSTWDVELSRFSGKISGLATQLQASGSKPECQEIGRQVQKLAGLISAPKAMPVELYLERLRELADQIQERACRLA